MFSKQFYFFLDTQRPESQSNNVVVTFTISLKLWNMNFHLAWFAVDDSKRSLMLNKKSQITFKYLQAFHIQDCLHPASQSCDFSVLWIQHLG